MTARSGPMPSYSDEAKGDLCYLVIFYQKFCDILDYFHRPGSDWGAGSAYLTGHYRALRVRIHEILQKPVFQRLRDLDWLPFADVYDMDPESESYPPVAHWRESCQHFLAEVRLAHRRLGAPSFPLSQQDQEAWLDGIDETLTILYADEDELTGRTAEAPVPPFAGLEPMEPDSRLLRTLPTSLDLSFIADPDLRDLAARDWGELQRAYAAECPKSVMVLAGTLLEVALVTALGSAENAAKAGFKRMTEKDGGFKQDLREGQPPDIARWRLYQLIGVARDLGAIKPDTATYAGMVRNLRNLVHISKERDSTVDMYRAHGAVFGLTLACTELAQWLARAQTPDANPRGNGQSQVGHNPN